MIRRYRIEGRIVAADDPDLQAILCDAHARKLRPLCLCREPGAPMYVAHLNDQYIVKRLPLSGEHHDPACTSHQLPYELSGLGPLIGSAIRIDAASGNAILNLGFALSHKGPRTEPAQETGAANAGAGGSVRAIPQKLALRALLHYLWDAAELTEWRASWHGRRNWHTVWARLRDAAAHMTTLRNGPLADNLFVPEPWSPDDREAIAARRAKALAGLHAPKGKSKKRMLIVGEIKKTGPARSGYKILVRHLPFPFLVDDALWQRLGKRFEAELEMREADEGVRLITIATFGFSVSGLAVIDQIALMSVTENWIPFETHDERRLVDRLAHLHEKSVKGLRFDLPADRPGICATLPRGGRDAVALHLVPANAGETYERHLAEAVAARPEIIHWIWRGDEGDMPMLPARDDRPQSKTMAGTP